MSKNSHFRCIQYHVQKRRRLFLNCRDYFPALTREAKTLSSRSSRVDGESNSTSLPSFSVRIRSESKTVPTRCQSRVKTNQANNDTMIKIIHFEHYVVVFILSALTNILIWVTKRNIGFNCTGQNIISPLTLKKGIQLLCQNLPNSLELQRLSHTILYKQKLGTGLDCPKYPSTIVEILIIEIFDLQPSVGQ